MSATRSFSRPSTSTARLKQDYIRLKRDPVPYVSAEPLPANILEWHYVVRGPSDSPYAGGFYHGHLVFPREFPFKPPAIYMRTPNGRFKTNTRLCLSISDFHPDSWNPAWSVATILTGLLSFMLETTPTYGSTHTSTAERRQLARASIEFNLACATFCDLFPDIVHEMQALREHTPPSARHRRAQAPSPSPPSATQPQTGAAAATATGAARPNGSLRAQHIRRPVAAAVRTNDPVAIGGGGGGAAAAAAVAALDPAENWQAVCSNVAVLIAFAALAYFVNHVIKNLNPE